jgi:cytochrome b561
MWILVFIVFFVLGVLSLRGVRWAYITHVSLGLLFFAARVGFRFHPQPCELVISIPLAIFSLTNYAHIVLFALFFLMTIAQFRAANRIAFAWAAVATISMGVLVELAEGVTGKGHCRLRDLVPDAAGILLGSALLLAWNGLRKRKTSVSL